MEGGDGPGWKRTGDRLKDSKRKTEVRRREGEMEK